MKSIQEIFPRASQSFLDANRNQGGLVYLKPNQNATTVNLTPKKAKHEANHQRKIQDSEPQHHQTPALDSANEGETQSSSRVIVRFVGYRVRPLDPDNFAGGCKDLLDALRHARLIHGDEPWRIDFQTAQEKVKSYAEERTVIEIEL